MEGVEIIKNHRMKRAEGNEDNQNRLMETAARRTCSTHCGVVGRSEISSDFGGLPEMEGGREGLKKLFFSFSLHFSVSISVSYDLNETKMHFLNWTRPSTLPKVIIIVVTVTHS